MIGGRMVVRPGPFALEEARIAVELAMASVRAWPWVVHRVLSATGLPHDVIDLILRVAFQPAPTAALVASVYRSAWERVQHRAQMVALLQPATPPALLAACPHPNVSQVTTASCSWGGRHNSL
jgi:hypothetical protein